MKSKKELLKAHGEILKGPLQIAFDITNKCNMKCLHCYNNSNDNNQMLLELSDREVMKFIKDIAKLKLYNFCICGGETLLRFDLVCKISKVLSQAGTKVSMVTNGLLLDREKAKKLYENGVSRVQISIDGGKKTSHEKLRQSKGSFEKAINALKFLKEEKIKDIGVAFTPTNFNINEIEEAFNICKDIGINEFRVQPLMILGRARKNIKDILPSKVQYRYLLNKLNHFKRENTNIIIEWGDPVDHLIRGKYNDELSTFITVQSNGDIVPSPYLPLSVGNVKKNKFSAYWKKGLYKAWKIDELQRLAQKVRSVSDFVIKDQSAPVVWEEENIKLDIIKNNYFK